MQLDAVLDRQRVEALGGVDQLELGEVLVHLLDLAQQPRHLMLVLLHDREVRACVDIRGRTVIFH